MKLVNRSSLGFDPLVAGADRQGVSEELAEVGGGRRVRVVPPGVAADLRLSVARQGRGDGDPPRIELTEPGTTGDVDERAGATERTARELGPRPRASGEVLTFRQVPLTLPGHARQHLQARADRNGSRRRGGPIVGIIAVTQRSSSSGDTSTTETRRITVPAAGSGDSSTSFGKRNSGCALGRLAG